MSERKDKGSPLVVVTDEARSATDGIVLAERLDDKTFLQLIAANENKLKANPFDAIAALVASRMLALGLDEAVGAKDLIFPTVKILGRTLKYPDREGKSPMEGTLVHLAQRLNDATSGAEVMNRGVALGDWGVVFASGLGVSTKFFAPHEQRQYGASMATNGYDRALAAADRSRDTSLAKRVMSTVPEIKGNLAAIIDVITYLDEEAILRIKAQNGVRTFATVPEKLLINLN